MYDFINTYKFNYYIHRGDIMKLVKQYNELFDKARMTARLDCFERLTDPSLFAAHIPINCTIDDLDSICGKYEYDITGEVICD